MNGTPVFPKIRKYQSCQDRPLNALTNPSFWKDASGGVIIYTALGMTAFLGVAALAIDVGSWFATKRSVQSAADAAALAGALEVSRSSDWATVVSKAEHDSGLNQHSTTGGASITVNNPPNSGSLTADNNAVEVIVEQTAPAFLSRVLGMDSVVVAARSVATVHSGENCVYVLDPSQNAALAVQGNTTVNLNCGVYVNSTSSNAANQTGSSCLTATSISTPGGASGSCLNPTPSEGAPSLDNPFSYMSAPAVGACDHTTLVEVTSPTTLDPGVYCGGLTIEDDVTLNPGEYVIEGQGLQIQGNSDVTGSEVSFLIGSGVTGYDPPGPTPPYSVYIAGSTDVELSAPLSGDYKGMLFYQDPGANPNLDLLFRGGTDMELEGVIYAPGHHLDWAGGSSTGDGWQMILSDTLTFTGNSNLQGGPSDPGALPVALVKPTLAE